MIREAGRGAGPELGGGRVLGRGDRLREDDVPPGGGDDVVEVEIVYEKLTIRLAAFVDSMSRGGRYRRLHLEKQGLEQFFVECDGARGRDIRTAMLDQRAS